MVIISIGKNRKILMDPSPLLILKASDNKQINGDDSKEEISNNKSNHSTNKKQLNHKKRSKTKLKKQSNRSLLHDQQQFLYLLCPYCLRIMKVEV